MFFSICPIWRDQSVVIARRMRKQFPKLRGEAEVRARIGQDIAAGAIESATEEKNKWPKGLVLLPAGSWDNALDRCDRWMSEKLDGVRAYWEGRAFRSRLGNKSTPRRGL